MKLLIASDIHGSAYWTERLMTAVKEEAPDRVVLLGDLLYHGPRNDLPRDYAPKRVIPLLNELATAGNVTAVRGNCDAEVDQMVLDFPILADYAQLIDPSGRVLFLTHGHVFGAGYHNSVDNLPALVYNRLKDLPPVKVYEAEYKRPDKNAQPTRPFTVERTGDHEFTVDAPWLERILAGTNVEDYESLQYFQTQLGDSGILDELVAQGVEEEDTIKIGEYEFDYLY